MQFVYPLLAAVFLGTGSGFFYAVMITAFRDARRCTISIEACALLPEPPIQCAPSVLLPYMAFSDTQQDSHVAEGVDYGGGLVLIVVVGRTEKIEIDTPSSLCRWLGRRRAWLGRHTTWAVVVVTRTYYRTILRMGDWNKSPQPWHGVRGVGGGDAERLIIGGTLRTSIAGVPTCAF